jgi:protoporphyrinogen oxidase
MKPLANGHIAIIGAGPAGLGAAYMLDRSGFNDWTLYEQDAFVGGLSRSVIDDAGFTWDIGGHVVFSHYGVYSRLLEQLLESSGWIAHERESWIKAVDTWVPYPFQNNVHRLPPPQQAACLEGLIRAALSRSDHPFTHFEDYILRTFGQGIADLFMLPYNKKVWAYPPCELGVGWMGERVAVPDSVRAVRNAVLQTDDVGWGPNDRFLFPRYGGTGAIWNALANQLPAANIRKEHKLIEWDVDAKQIRFSNGREDRYDWLISTMPLDQLAALSKRKAWIEAASGLKHSATNIVGVGLTGKPSAEMASKCWMYFPEDNCPFYRTTHFSLYSPNNVDDIDKHWSLMTETSESPHKPVNPDQLIQDTLDGLLAAKLIEDANQVSHTWLHRVEYGYPTPTPDRDAILNFLLPDLAKVGVLSRGRFGAWRYEVGNMDHSFMQGFEAAGWLLCGSPEITIWDPSLVNKRHPVLGWDRIR